MATAFVRMRFGARACGLLRLQNKKVSAHLSVPGFAAVVRCLGQTSNGFDDPTSGCHRHVGAGHFWQHARQRFEALQN